VKGIAVVTVIKFADIPVLDRGGAVRTWPLITAGSTGGTAKVTTGMSIYPVGSGAPLHCHNCDEQVLILQGQGFVEVDGQRTDLVQWDTAYVEEGIFHRYHNTGEVPMKILWIYNRADVTRTFADTGTTVQHLTPQDQMGGRS
jgi:mannose-6-phosphate isomerase-like protein (cupin superfamily)